VRTGHARSVLVARALVVATVLAGAACSDGTPPSSDLTVTEVIDGDTITVALRGAHETVRLIGVDTPETKHPTKPVQCFGPEASAFTHRLVPPGTVVRLERDAEARDHFGRLLAYVYRADDGLFVNLELARAGFARPLSIAPNTAHANEIAQVANQARHDRRGLWPACPSG
jgi:micrococcal nuclease